MSELELETRLLRLEKKVDHLVDLIEQQQDPSKRTTDLDKVTGFFGDDPVIKRIFREAEKYREQNRREARQTSKKRRRAKS